MNLYEPVNNRNKIRYRHMNPHVNREIEVTQAGLRQAYRQEHAGEKKIERRPTNKFIYAFVQLLNSFGKL